MPLQEASLEDLESIKVDIQIARTKAGIAKNEAQTAFDAADLGLTKINALIEQNQ